MASIKLKKVVFREENLKVIEHTASSLEIKIAVEDFSGIIYGDVKELKDKEKHEVTVENEIIGWVLGDKKAYTIALILSAMCKSELEKKALADETLEKYREINILYNVSEKIATTAGVGSVANVVAAEAMKHIDSDFSAILLLNEDGESFETVCETGNKISINETFVRNIVKPVINKKSGEIINDIERIEGVLTDKIFLKSLICTPIAAKNKVIGVMLIGSSSIKEYTASDLKLCNALAAQGGAAIEATKLYESLRENFFDTIQILSQIIEMRDSYKNGHYLRVMNYSLNIGRAMGMSRVELVKLKLAVMLHDIGNLAISDELLTKRSSYTEEEFEIVKAHAETGASMLQKIDQLKQIIPVIRSHHERYDGKGYPDGLKGEQIPICSRIIAVADAFDAMTNDRPHKASMNLYFAAEELSKNKGIQFDPNVVDTFFRIYKDKKLEEIQEYVYKE